MQCINKINCYCFVFLLAGSLLTAPYPATGSVEKQDESITPVLKLDSGQTQDIFEYQLEGRPDPFLPFISKQVATQTLKADDIVDENTELSGMRKFEPGQLTLVAVMFASNRAMAMVEDVTGKGYILTEGMPIGRRGIISHIDDDQVTVIETAHTRAGRKLENTIVMRMNKEGDK